MSSLARLLTGFAATWVLWTAAVLKEGADNAVFRILFGSVACVILVGIAWLAGLTLRFAQLTKLWSRLGPFILFFFAVGAGIILFSDQLGLIHTAIDPDSGEPLKVMNPWLMLGAYFCAAFPIVNWPCKPRANN